MRATELLPWCIDHPAEDTPALDDAAEDEVDVLVPLEPVEPVVVVPVGLVAVGSEGVVVRVWVPTDNPSAVTEPVIERDEAASGGASGVESEDADEDDDDEEPELGEVIWVMAKAGLVSPESPNTIVQTSTS